MKNKWGNYALKNGKVKESYIREYSCRSPKRQAREASGCNSLLECRKEQEKEVKEYSCCQGHYFNSNESTHSIMGGHACPYCPVTQYMIPIKRNKDERERKEEPSKAYQEGRQGIQESDQRRCETLETNYEIKTGEEKVKEKEKMSTKEKKHEAKEGKKYEKMEDKREARKEAKGKKK